MGRWEWFCPVTGEKLARTFAAGEEVALGLSAEGAERLAEAIGRSPEEVQSLWDKWQREGNARHVAQFVAHYSGDF